MNFTSSLFLFVVLPAVLGGYWLCARKWQNSFLLLVSMALYAWGAPEFFLVVLLFSSLDWLLAFRIAAAPAGSRKRRALTAFGVVANLGVLVVAKYANFGVAMLNGVRDWTGVRPVAWTDIALPIGVSFVIFEKISYLVDVARGTVRPLRSLGSYLLYTFLFPKMFAGPIVRFHTIRDQLTDRVVDDEDRAYGLSRFTLGLAKKVVIANTLSRPADEAFRIVPSELSTATAWFGMLCFGLQVYFDFSGYSDMAIGMARCFGFRLSENFRYPYAAASTREFWERWHISLSSWIRDYLYIPLGGSRRGEPRTYVNLWICFLACGLWHGANWTFVVWGAMHGLGLTVQRRYERLAAPALPRFLSVGLTFLFVMFSMVLFRAPSIAHAALYYRALFSAPTSFFLQVSADNVIVLVFVLGLLSSLVPGVPAFLRLRRWLARDGRYRTLMKACAAPLLVLSAARALAEEATPFLYFRF